MRIGGERNRGRSAGAPEERRRVIRLYLLALVCAVWMAVIGIRLWDLQVRQASALAGRAERQQGGLIEMPAERGEIYDRRGVALAMSSRVESIAVFAEKVGDPELIAPMIAQATGVSQATVRRELGKKGFRWIKRLAEPRETDRLRAMNIRGVHFEEASKRYYPKGSAAAHLLGYVSIDQKGQGGLELRYDDLLRGRSGKRQVSVDADGEEYEFQIVEAPIPGADLFLTIDERIQAAAEDSLRRAISETRARAGSIVVLDPHTGDVLAMASRPTFDPNVRPRRGTKKELEAELGRRSNYAVSHLYEPGSTFKIVTVAAALEEGLARPEEVIDCRDGWIYVGRRRIRDHKKFGPLTVTDILARSSNVGVIKLGQRLEAGRLRDYVRRFGFGEKTGVELPGESAGLVWPLKQWREGSVASVAMGHEIGATPLQMAVATAVIANGGYWVKPRLVDSIRDASGQIQRLEPSERKRVISAETAAKLRAMMEQTVLTGTGRLASTPGYRSGGKTGTAQMIDPDTGAYSHDLYMAGYTGFAPLNDPAMAAIIVLEAPRGKYYGGATAAPVFPELAAQTLRFRDVPPELPLESPGVEPDEIELEALADLALTAPAEPAPAALERAADGAIYVAANGETEEPEHAASAARREVRLRVTQIRTPNFRGMAMRRAVAEGVALGLRLETRGDGVAVTQDPPAGTPVARGSRVRLEFGRLTAQARVGR